MKRVPFDTGQKHQAAIAAWVRRRLADRRGGWFEAPNEEPGRQGGCLLADGVGLGKTWEALAAVALLLDKHDLRKRRRRARYKSRGGRVNQRRREARVLVLVPPGLVAKWSRELHNPEADSFPDRLRRWADKPSRRFIADTLSPANCYVIRRRRDLEALPRGSKKSGSYVLPAGTYICNWNVFGKGGRGLDRVNALKNQRWEVVVVDEAHHRRARASLDKLRHPTQTLLLTATPFQLDMTELHGLTKHLLLPPNPQHRILKRGAVRTFATAAAAAFDKKDAPRPTKDEKRAAEGVLRQLVACSDLGRQKRHYHVIDARGQATRIAAPTELEADNLEGVFAHAIEADETFRPHYLEHRLDLARGDGGKQRHVAIELQKLLSVRRAPAPTSPRLAALVAWARGQFDEDLRATLVDGLPRKLLLFTHLKTDVAQPIRRALEAELASAHARVARSPAWKALRKAAPARLAAVLKHVREAARDTKARVALDRFAKSIRGTLYEDLFGHATFARRARNELLELVSDGEDTDDGATAAASASVAAWREAQRQSRLRSARALLGVVGEAPLAATFTGDETRKERDAIAEAFESILAPWILVATNVGSEGIDLHTYSRHLVHFDLEWNPARMEQREGRIDRLGRQHKEPANIYYLLVKDTYDERMFHQLIARQRWQGVLLGRKALQLAREDIQARLLSRKERDTMSLDLDPQRPHR